MDTIQHLLPYLFHIDDYLITFVSTYGFWIYVLLFVIIFCETGLVITPFLPGDSLLFTAGSLAAHTNQVLNIQLLFLLLVIASILGNKLNYLIGMTVGPRIFTVQKGNDWRTKLFNKNHLEKAHLFYEKHGGKTIIFARFIPIIRTFVPFVAGISYMSLKRFAVYNILSAIFWIGSLLGAGYFFGNLPFIKQHFSLVVYGIIGFSLLPPLVAFFYRSSLKRTSC